MGVEYEISKKISITVFADMRRLFGLVILGKAHNFCSW